MKSKALGLLIVMVMVVLLAVPVGAAPAPDQSSAPGLADAAPSGSDTGVYIVRLEGAALSSYEGGIAGLEATSPAATGEAKLDVKSPASVAYLDYLAGRHDQFIAAMEQTLDRSVEVLFRYDVVLNGMAVRLSAEEAARVAALPGVVDVQPETIEYPDTDVGPTWIGAPGIWSGSAVPGGIGTHGEGVIVGMLDTGINHDHPSFADVGDDGYNHTNPWGANNYVGYCVTDDPTFCNDKLIGAWSFVTEAVTPEDSNGHGSHTASTAAGNVYNATKTTPTGFLVQAQISGVAPHANVIMYDVCTSGCPSSSSVAAVNQAVADGVDVINFSISGGNNPYGDSVELAFLDANTAGVFVSTSAGNNGPGASTVAHRSPWVSTVAASTHNRLYTNQLINMTGGTTPPADITGQSISTGYGPAPIVYAGDYGNALCAPFGGVIFSGEIVVCDRGTYGRVEKGQNVLNAGGGGYILANDAASGDSLVADPHVLPATHITYSDGVVLKAWLAAGSGHQGTITTTSTDLSPINGDIMASFSSRGPNTTFDVLKPDMTAPGVAIFAAYMNGIELEWLGGTSMSSPHNAGAGALMKALYPSWTPSEIKSAIMTTSWTDNLRKEDGVTPADAFDVGAGRDNLMQAALAGIVFDETRANYQAANPALGGDPKTLNMPSFQNNDCEGTCTWTRVVSSTQASTVSWTAADSAPGGVAMTVEPAAFDLPAGGTQLITVTADVTGLPIGVWAFDEVTLTPAAGSPIPEAHLPVAVVAQPAAQPPVISVDPESFDTTQAADTVETYPLTVTNSGGSDLTWSIYEAAGPASGATRLVDWSDDFDSYATDLSLHGVGGWKGWGNSPAATAYTRDEQAISTPNSVEIVNVSDLVHEYTGVTSGLWTYTAWQYIPAGFTGESYFILLNQYDDAGATNNWSTQVDFNGTTNTVVNDGPAAGTLPLVRGQWMEIRVEIDLDNDVQSFYYGGDLLFTGSWTDGLSGGGILNVAAVDLWGNNASAVYYDDLSLVKYVPPVCDVPSEIPWVSVAPTSGTTLPGADSMVDVTFDTTGLTVGMAYTGTLCVSSNDPATPVVAVPLTLLVVFRDVELSPVAQTLTGAPGEIVTHTFTLTNTGLMTDTFELSVAGNNWPTSVAGSTGDLAPGEATTVDVAVTIPDTPAIRQVPIASDSFTLTAASMADDDVMAQAVGTTVAEVNPIVDLSADQVGYGVAGEQVSYVFLVTNNGDYTDTFTLELTGEVWTSTLSIADSGALAPGASQAMTLTVDIPADAVVGDSDMVTLVATSMLDPALSDSALATTIVQATPAVDLGADQAGSGAAGSQVTYVFLVTNSGDYTDTFTLELTGGVWASTLSITETAELAPGASQAVTLTVDIPTDAAAGATDVVTLTAISMLDPEVSDSATATTQVTTVQRWFYFVPIILKN